MYGYILYELTTYFMREEIAYIPGTNVDVSTVRSRRQGGICADSHPPAATGGTGFSGPLAFPECHLPATPAHLNGPTTSSLMPPDCGQLAVRCCSVEHRFTEVLTSTGPKLPEFNECMVGVLNIRNCASYVGQTAK